MELEWEQERQSTCTAVALAGAFLGAALGADCFLAADHLIGGIPALLCGAAIAFWAVKSGVLFAGRNSQAVALLALLPTLLWGNFCQPFEFRPRCRSWRSSRHTTGVPQSTVLHRRHQLLVSVGWIVSGSFGFLDYPIP